MVLKYWQHLREVDVTGKPDTTKRAPLSSRPHRVSGSAFEGEGVLVAQGSRRIRQPIYDWQDARVMSEDDMTRVLRALLVSAKGWVPEPQIQRLFRELTGSIVYKPAMDRLRQSESISHEATVQDGKKFWQYRIG